MSEVEEEGIRFEVRDQHIAIITLDRPKKRNAITGAMARAIDAALKKTEADPDIRVLVIGSSSDVFCAGADLSEVEKGNAADLRTADGGFAGLAFQPHSKPWIAAVSGPALAGGCEIALASDMILAAPGATFGVPEVRRGLIASAGGVFRLPRLVPRNIAFEMIATGEPIDAAEAWRIGLINRIFPLEQLFDAAIAVAGKIAANAPLSVRESLEIARLAESLDEEDLKVRSRAAADRLLATEDVREGARAFLEKRAPRWLGR